MKKNIALTPRERAALVSWKLLVKDFSDKANGRRVALGDRPERVRAIVGLELTALRLEFGAVLASAGGRA